MDTIRNKKIRGATKKQRDMLKQLNDKLKIMRATREHCEELAMTMEFLEGGAIKPLKQALKKYYQDPDNGSLRENVEAEVSALIETADKNRKDEDLLHSGTLLAQEEEKASEADQKYGYLNWLHRLVDLTQPCN